MLLDPSPRPSEGRSCSHRDITTCVVRLTYGTALNCQLVKTRYFSMLACCQTSCTYFLPRQRNSQRAIRFWEIIALTLLVASTHLVAAWNAELFLQFVAVAGAFGVILCSSTFCRPRQGSQPIRQENNTSAACVNSLGLRDSLAANSSRRICKSPTSAILTHHQNPPNASS